MPPAPCIPQNLQTSADCSSDVLLSKWDLAEGALRYTVEAYGNKGDRTHYNCSTVSNSCAIQGVHCGDVLTIYITAYDNECSSPRTLQPVAETGEKAVRLVFMQTKLHQVSNVYKKKITKKFKVYCKNTTFKSQTILLCKLVL